MGKRLLLATAVVTAALGLWLAGSGGWPTGCC